MRRFDKRKNIMEANIRLETSYLKDKMTLSESLENNFQILNEKNEIRLGDMILPGFWESCLVSEAFNVDEKSALNELFNSVGIGKLNENILKQAYVWFREKINDASEWMANLGQKGYDALKSGFKKMGDFFNRLGEQLNALWEKIKKIFVWVYEQAKEGVSKISGKLKPLVTQFGSDWDKLQKTEDHDKIHKDMINLAECSSHVKNNFLPWVKNLFSDPKGPTHVLDNVKNEAEKEMKEELPESFKKYDIINLCLKGNHSLIMEGGDLSEIEWGWKEFLMVIIKSVSWLFNPIGRLIEQITKWVVKKIFTVISVLSKFLKGPGSYEFVTLSALGVGVSALIMDLKHFGLPEWVGEITDFLIGLIPGISDIKEFFHMMHYVVLGALIVEVLMELISPYIQSKEKTH